MKKTIRLNPFHGLVVTFCVWLLCISFSTESHAGDVSFPEGKIKAAYIYNFLRFIEWPDDTDPSGLICIIGSKQEYRRAFHFLTTQEFNNKNITLHEFNTNNEIKLLETCQLVFVTSEASEEQKNIISSFKGGKFLTVGDSEDYTQSGGMISFVRTSSKIGFIVNLAAANESGIRISSKVLRLAEKVTE